MDYIISIIPQMLLGTVDTLRLFFITIVLAIPLGILLAFCRVSSFKILRNVVAAYVYVLRGTPLMLQLLFVYFGLPFIPVIGIRLDDFPAAVLAFVLNYGAYFCEIFRAGIQAIPKGQYEAAKTLGMNYVQTMKRIILPQVFKIILPPVSNETITLVKDTSLIYVLAMNDLLRTTRNLVQRDFNIMPFVVAAVFYLVMTLILTFGFNKLEKHFARWD
ncbi:MAG: amino acid ABC transporter permease [Succiniclasticum sp.]|uniref:Amino acid ABC transporter membrane protein, PAAT family n=1 Tax=Succiniclasticum ruminis TaxID=40841 RepID=A0A1G6KE43_9FIRM|nr:amino acid ABC transporter permease [Succiniclasticum ruminis]MBQ1778966.1 amino acid ABC transporter permease [Acidaminococcaceae bacterium]MEE3454817.1 amino acid ABC transporter permease [Succiniclasticum sp.]MBQ2141351.1 amino acid ABC transporter permease [Acidaminococcaceae bacterium]MBQ2221683.1 amino acid ABC transporter permease [Acidaminococcaceae bacterium]MBQ2343172.1 amino acid ABC transporter permease [Acidaminococcaceae bacterium]